MRVTKVKCAEEDHKVLTDMFGRDMDLQKGVIKFAINLEVASLHVKITVLSYRNNLILFKVIEGNLQIEFNIFEG